MKKEEILKKFNEKYRDVPLPDLSQEDQYSIFCQRLSDATRKIIEEHNVFVARTSAAAMDQPFGF